MTKNCKHCNTPFTCEHGRYVFCSDTCKIAFSGASMKAARRLHPWPPQQCLGCGVTFTPHHHLQTHCKRRCQKASRLCPTNPYPIEQRHARGAASEHRIVADLLDRNFIAERTGTGAGADVLAYKDGHAYRIEVKRYDRPGRQASARCTTFNAATCDVIAYECNGTITYFDSKSRERLTEPGRSDQSGFFSH